MADKKISEMSYEELKLYEKELSNKLTVVKFYLRVKFAKSAKKKPHK